MDTSRRSAVLTYILHEVPRDRVWAISHRPFTRSCLHRLDLLRSEVREAPRAVGQKYPCPAVSSTWQDLLFIDG
jgi:hypothetical protein